MAMPNNVATALRKNKPGSTNIHGVKPDIDNLQKFVLDSISNGVLLTDDKIVYSIKATKLYDERPRTEFTITEI
jgi:Holliday junction resolvase RusA-like endonuclease